jgi:hypothetical protein
MVFKIEDIEKLRIKYLTGEEIQKSWQRILMVQGAFGLTHYQSSCPIHLTGNYHIS